MGLSFWNKLKRKLRLFTDRNNIIYYKGAKGANPMYTRSRTSTNETSTPHTQGLIRNLSSQQIFTPYNFCTKSSTPSKTLPFILPFQILKTRHTGADNHLS